MAEAEGTDEHGPVRILLADTSDGFCHILRGNKAEKCKHGKDVSLRASMSSPESILFSWSAPCSESGTRQNAPMQSLCRQGAHRGWLAWAGEQPSAASRSCKFQSTAPSWYHSYNYLLAGLEASLFRSPPLKPVSGPELQAAEPSHKLLPAFIHVSIEEVGIYLQVLRPQVR